MASFLRSPYSVSNYNTSISTTPISLDEYNKLIYGSYNKTSYGYKAGYKAQHHEHCVNVDGKYFCSTKCKLKERSDSAS